MHCRTCMLLDRTDHQQPKAKVVKTESDPERTHRIYRCPNQKCEETFHTIEISRERFRELTRIESRAQDFADEFHR